jgi:hypothetical protein
MQVWQDSRMPTTSKENRSTSTECTCNKDASRRGISRARNGRMLRASPRYLIGWSDSHLFYLAD